MKIVLSSILVLLLCVALPFAGADAANPRVQLETNQGNIVIELYPQNAPKTVDNFLYYVNNGFYDGTIFHRVIKGFMIQGGGFSVDMRQKPTQSPISNEADNGLKNERGTIAMARTNQPDSATSQFFINTVDNGPLDHRSKTAQGWGYCVFGKVVSGMDVVDAIENGSTAPKGMHRNMPTKQVVITKATVTETKASVDKTEKSEQ